MPSAMNLNQITEELRTIATLLKNLDVKPNGWNEWAKHVLSTIEELKTRLETVPSRRTCEHMDREVHRMIDQFEAIEEKVNSIKEDLAVIRTHLDNKVDKADFRELQTEMKARAGLIGVLAGAIPALAVLIWNYFKP